MKLSLCVDDSGIVNSSLNHLIQKFELSIHDDSPIFDSRFASNIHALNDVEVIRFV